MTTRELRIMLTAVTNQELTVKQLRGILYEVIEQDDELSADYLMLMTSDKIEK